MKSKVKGKGLNVVSHVIVPLICFAAGLMLAATFTHGGQGNMAQSDSSAQGVRLMECMGQTNDLENLKVDLEHQLANAQRERDELHEQVERAKTEAAEATAALAEARKLGAHEPSAGSQSGAGLQVSLPADAAEEEEGANWAKETEEEGAWAKQVAAKGSDAKALQWQRVGVWQATDLEPQSFSNMFDIGLPINTIKWSGGTLLLPAKLGHGAKGKMEAHGSALDHVQAQCSELDVMVLNDNHCVAVTTVNGNQAGHNTPYHITRFKKGGYKHRRKSSEPSKGADEWEQVSRLTSKSGSNEGAPPGQYALKTHRRALSKFFQSVDEVENELKPVLRKAAKDNTVITMTMNSGMADLILNFVCSAKKAGTPIDQLVLFPTDDAAVDVAKALGVGHYRHASFGQFPKEEAASYGDNTFVAMMWIKVLCVYLPVNLGYSVLFQDADVVWLRDPLKEYFNVPELAGDFDVYFQDDGSRSTRFSPYFSNSGFYFLRSNPRTKYFMTMFLYQGDQILEWRSHQSALVQTLVDASSKFGLKVKTLSYEDFPSGKDYHHRKPFMKAWLGGHEDPYAFHMCWTQNKVDKVKYLKQLGGWFMHRTCHEDSLKTTALLSQGPLQDTCCSAEPVLDCFFRDKASKAPGCPDSPNKDKGQQPWW